MIWLCLKVVFYNIQKLTFVSSLVKYFYILFVPYIFAPNNFLSDFSCGVQAVHRDIFGHSSDNGSMHFDSPDASISGLSPTKWKPLLSEGASISFLFI